MYLRLSLYCRRETRLRISVLYPSSLENRKDSLSIPIASDVRPRAIISKSENLETTPHLGILPDSFTKLSANCLQMSRNLMNIAYKLCVELIVINSLVTTNLLNISDMYNFFNTHTVMYLIPPRGDFIQFYIFLII